MVMVNIRHFKSCRTESMFICSTTVLSTWPVIICDITGTPTWKKNTSVKAKQEKPQLKVLNTGNCFCGRIGFLFHNSDLQQILHKKGLNVDWKCARTAVEKDSNIV